MVQFAQERKQDGGGVGVGGGGVLVKEAHNTWKVMGRTKVVIEGRDSVKDEVE